MPDATKPRSRRRLLKRLAITAVVIALLLSPLVPRPALSSGPYVQAVTSDSAVVRISTAEPRRFALFVDDREVPIESSGAAPQIDHRFVIDGLEAGTRHGYRIVEGDTEVERGSFRTFADRDDATVGFAVIGDSGDQPFWIDLQRAPLARALDAIGVLPGTSPAPRAIGQLLDARDPGFWIHAGDVIYPHGEIHYYETGFFRPFAAVLAKSCCIPVLGNHDLMSQDGAPFERCFEWSGRAEDGRHFSFRDGPLRVVGLDLNDKVGPDHSSLRFLRDQAAFGEPWLVVVSHYPIHSVYRKQPRPDLLEHYLPLCQELGVDLIFAGHDHLYQRFGQPGPDGEPIEIGTGGGGKDLYVINNRPPELATATVAHHACFVTIEGPTLRFEAIDLDGNRIDSFEIDKRAMLETGTLRGNDRRTERVRALVD